MKREGIMRVSGKKNGTVVDFFIFMLAFVCFFARFSTLEQKAAKNDDHLTTDLQNIMENVHISSTSLRNYTLSSRSSPTRAPETEADTLPEELGEFIESLPDSVIDSLPEGVFSDDPEELRMAASEAGGVAYLLGRLFDAFGTALTDLVPILATLCGIIVLSAVAHTFASSLGAGLASAVGFAARLCSYCSIAALSVSAVGRLQQFFDGLVSSVTAFLPLSGVLYAMGGNFTGAVSGSATLSAILTFCQLFLGKSVLPVFFFCLSLTLLQTFDGVGGFAGQSISATVKKWYSTALGFVMMILTTSLAAQSILSAKADSAAMRGAKFAAGSFIPVAGGTISSTLGTLAASVELMRGSVGIVGVVVVLLMLIPVVVFLALLRGIFALSSFLAGVLGCHGEQRLLSEVGALYGYLEGIAALSSVVFLVAFALFATTASAV